MAESVNENQIDLTESWSLSSYTVFAKEKPGGHFFSSLYSHANWLQSVINTFSSM